MGKSPDGAVDVKAGLGTSIVQALAKELDARVEVVSGRGGTTISISHNTSTEAARAA